MLVGRPSRRGARTRSRINSTDPIQCVAVDKRSGNRGAGARDASPAGAGATGRVVDTWARACAIVLVTIINLWNRMYVFNVCVSYIFALCRLCA